MASKFEVMRCSHVISFSRTGTLRCRDWIVVTLVAVAVSVALAPAGVCVGLRFGVRVLGVGVCDAVAVGLVVV